MTKLTLLRDFTRFLDEDEFPHRVEVYLGDKKLVCSGMIIAQQSSVLEQKIRDEHGILMLDEMLEIGSDGHKYECMRLLYGAAIEFNLDNIETVLKFSSIYMVEDMFVKAIKWIKQTMTCRNFQLYYMLHKQMCSPYFERFQKIITEFIGNNANQCGNEMSELLDSNQDIDQDCFVEVLKNKPMNGGVLLTRWVRKTENIPMLLKTADDLDFFELFPDQSGFTVFLNILTQQNESMETMKAALTLQQNYFTNYSKQQHESAEKASNSKDVPDDKSDTKSTASKAKSKGKKQSPKEAGNKNSNSKQQNTKSSKNEPDNRREKPSSSKAKPGAKKASPKESADKNPKQQNKNEKKDTKPTTEGTTDEKVLTERKIFVGNIPDNVTNEEMEKVFSDYGVVVGIDLVPLRKCAFVEFRSVKASRKILNLVNVDKDAIKIMDTAVYIKPFNPNINANPEKKVFVGNLPENATVKDLKLAFATYGPPKTVTLVSQRKCAFLEFDDVKTVRKILNMFANGQIFSVLSTKVYVKPFEVQQD